MGSFGGGLGTFIGELFTFKGGVNSFVASEGVYWFDKWEVGTVFLLPINWFGTSFFETSIPKYLEHAHAYF